jgi:DNA-binding NarL/FixJ family response regulator
MACDPKKLTPRESQVVGLMASPDKVIASELRISIHTVRHHFQAIARKLNAHSRIEILLKIMEKK